MRVDKWDPEAYQDLQEQGEDVEGEALEGLQDQLDQVASLAHLEGEACLEVMALQVPRVKMETEESLVHQGPRAKGEMLVDPELQVCRVLEDSREEEV